MARKEDADLGGITAWGRVTGFTDSPEGAVPGEVVSRQHSDWVAATGTLVLMLT